MCKSLKTVFTTIQIVAILALLGTIVNFGLRFHGGYISMLSIPDDIMRKSINCFDWVTGYDIGFKNDPNHSKFDIKLKDVRKQSDIHTQNIEKTLTNFRVRSNKMKTLLIQETVEETGIATLDEQVKDDRRFISGEGDKLITLCSKVENLLIRAVSISRICMKHIKSFQLREEETKKAFEDRFYIVELPLLKARIQEMIYNVGNTSTITHKIQDSASTLCAILKQKQLKYDKEYIEHSKPISRTEHLKRLGIGFCGGALIGGAFAAAISAWIDPISMSTELLLSGGSMVGAGMASTYKLYTNKLEVATKSLAARSSGSMSLEIGDMITGVKGLEAYSGRILTHLDHIFIVLRDVEMKSMSLEATKSRDVLIEAISENFMAINIIYEQNIVQDRIVTS